jgi:hypothetical protein
MHTIATLLSQTHSTPHRRFGILVAEDVEDEQPRGKFVPQLSSPCVMIPIPTGCACSRSSNSNSHPKPRGGGFGRAHHGADAVQEQRGLLHMRVRCHAPLTQHLRRGSSAQSVGAGWKRLCGTCCTNTVLSRTKAGRAQRIGWSGWSEAWEQCEVAPPRCVRTPPLP